MSSLDDLLALTRVKVHAVSVEVAGASQTLYFREPSALDQIRIRQLQDTQPKGAKASIPGYLVLPLLWCKDSSGQLAFEDYEAGIRALNSMEPAAMATIVNACLGATRLGEASVEEAEKKS